MYIGWLDRFNLLAAVYQLIQIVNSKSPYSEGSLILVVIHYHSVGIRIHVGWVLPKITKHLIWHLWHSTSSASTTIHLHPWWHHARHPKLLLVKSVHHSWSRIGWKWHLKPIWRRTCRIIHSSLIRWQVFHPLLRVHVHELTLHHQRKSLHLLKVLLLSECFNKLLRRLRTWCGIRWFTFQITILFLSLR